VVNSSCEVTRWGRPESRFRPWPTLLSPGPGNPAGKEIRQGKNTISTATENQQTARLLWQHSEITQAPDIGDQGARFRKVGRRIHQYDLYALHGLTGLIIGDLDLDLLQGLWRFLVVTATGQKDQTAQNRGEQGVNGTGAGFHKESFGLDIT